MAFASPDRKPDLVGKQLSHDRGRIQKLEVAAVSSSYPLEPMNVTQLKKGLSAINTGLLPLCALPATGLLQYQASNETGSAYRALLQAVEDSGGPRKRQTLSSASRCMIA